MLVMDDRHGEGIALHLAKARQQLVERARIDVGARQDVRPDFGALFQHADFDLAARLLGQLFQPDRRAQARRAAANDDDIIFHAFAFFVTHAFVRPS